MKIAIIADIHSNFHAFSRVLHKIKQARADALLFAGDLIGYYFQPSECFQLLLEWDGPFFAVRGNHEEMLLEAIDSPKVRNRIFSRYGPGINIAIDQLTKRQIDWIANLPHPLSIRSLGCSILLCHGSPHEINKYVYPDTSIEKILLTLDEMPQVLIMGHTHYPFIRFIEGCLVVNPGSVGQPRNRVVGAHWAMLDTSTMTVRQYTEPYDMSGLIEACHELAPSMPYLREVLTRS